MKAATMQSEILRELEYMCDVAGLPVARYVYSFGTGEASIIIMGGGIDRRLNKNYDNKIAAPSRVQFHNVVVVYLD